MPSRMIEWVAEQLDVDERIIVPLRELWNDWQSLGAAVDFPRFARAVLEDHRIEEVYSIDLDSQIESVGSFSGPRVKLRSREITERCVLRLIRSHHERVIEALCRAVEILREDPSFEGKGELSHAIQMLSALRRPSIPGPTWTPTMAPPD
jgi:hypothetical protein